MSFLSRVQRQHLYSYSQILPLGMMTGPVFKHLPLSLISKQIRKQDCIITQIHWLGGHLLGSAESAVPTRKKRRHYDKQGRLGKEGCT